MNTSSASIYSRFNLLPPPPPTIFSRDTSPNRARLPEFENAQDVSDFLIKIVLRPRSPLTYEMLPFEAAYILFLISYVACAIVLKIKNGSWWVIRMSLRENGRVIIPHTHNLWTLLIGAFGIIFAAVCVLTRICNDRQEAFPHRGLVWTLMWSPLCLGSAYQGWALYYAETDGQRSLTDRISSKRRYVPPAWLLNSFFILLPIIGTFACLYPAIDSDKKYQAVTRLWLSWKARYGSEQELSQEMLLDAQQIWYDLIRAAYIFTYGQICWFVMLICVGTIHILLAWRLVINLYLHLQRLRSLCQAHTGQRTTTLAPPRSAGGSSWSKWTKRTTVASQPSRQGMLVEAEQVRSRLVTPESETNDRAPEFFPPIKPSKVITSMPRSQADRVLLYFAVQALTVTLGGAALMSNLIWIIVATQPTMEAAHPAHMEEVAWDIDATIVLVLGTLTAISTTHTFFEASFAALVSGCHLWITGAGTEQTSGSGAASGSGSYGPPTAVAKAFEQMRRQSMDKGSQRLSKIVKFKSEDDIEAKVGFDQSGDRLVGIPN
ncbi:hypothetical protein OC842_003825 [Tilletia horrida]|uniref:Uncharacterized protein n=1 Tax=Tilletia horrida TaxID=155126 RepID=A0AAN6GC64_9BASI|nr:hypothetical protein OC842_003825 [Tilletia horrida]